MATPVPSFGDPKTCSEVASGLVTHPTQRIVFQCDVGSGPHKFHHQYFERSDGTVADIVWLAESDRASLTRVDSKVGNVQKDHDEARSKVILSGPRTAEHRRAIPNKLDADKQKVKLVRKKQSAEDW